MIFGLNNRINFEGLLPDLTASEESGLIKGYLIKQQLISILPYRINTLLFDHIHTITLDEFNLAVRYSRGQSIKNSRLLEGLSNREKGILLCPLTKVVIARINTPVLLQAIAYIKITKGRYPSENHDFFQEVYFPEFGMTIHRYNSLQIATIAKCYELIYCHQLERRELNEIIDYIHSFINDRDTLRKSRVSQWTLKSLLRRSREWHREFHLGYRRTRVMRGDRFRRKRHYSWDPILKSRITYKHQGEEYVLYELCSTEELRLESVTLQHCVASYDLKCMHGRSRIFSLSVIKTETPTPLLTIEYDPSSRSVVQIKGEKNRNPTDIEEFIVHSVLNKTELVDNVYPRTN